MRHRQEPLHSCPVFRSTYWFKEKGDRLGCAQGRACVLGGVVLLWDFPYHMTVPAVRVVQMVGRVDINGLDATKVGVTLCERVRLGRKSPPQTVHTSL